MAGMKSWIIGMVALVFLALVPAQQTNGQKALLRAAEIVESGWCQGAGARDAGGVWVDAASPRAVKWCASAAVDKAAAELGTDKVIRISARNLLFQRINLRRMPKISIARWNDTPGRTAAQVANQMREAAK